MKAVGDAWRRHDAEIVLLKAVNSAMMGTPWMVMAAAASAFWRRCVETLLLLLLKNVMMEIHPLEMGALLSVMWN